MYGIVQVIGNKTAGTIFFRKTWKGAVTVATKIALQNLKEPDDPKETEVRAEIEQTGNYEDNNGEWTVCIESAQMPE
jgi:hypothetical protein